METSEYASNIVPATRKFRKGVTLLELLIAIAIISVLVTILLVSLAAIRNTAASTSDAINLRTCALAISDYADQNDGSVPGLVAKKHHARAFFDGNYFQGWTAQTSLWPSKLADALGPEPERVLTSPWIYDPNIEPQPTTATPDQPLLGSTYWMGFGFMYQDVVFTPERPDAAWQQPELMGLRRLHEARYPSDKGLLISIWSLNAERYSDTPGQNPLHLNSPAGQDAPYNAAFVDGSVGVIVPSSAPDRYDLYDASTVGTPVIDTAGGLAGVDR